MAEKVVIEEILVTTILPARVYIAFEKNAVLCMDCDIVLFSLSLRLTDFLFSFNFHHSQAQDDEDVYRQCMHVITMQ